MKTKASVVKNFGLSLRARLASAEVDERYVQKQLGHTSAETRKYQTPTVPVDRRSAK